MTDGEKNRLRYYHDQIHDISKRMIEFNDWKLFIDYEENLTIANHAHSDLFLEPLFREIPQYSPEDLEERKRLGINKSTLWYVKKNLESGSKIKVYKKISDKLESK